MSEHTVYKPMIIAFEGPRYDIDHLIMVGGTPKKHIVGKLVDFIVFAAKEYTPEMAGLSDGHGVLHLPLEDDGKPLYKDDIDAIRSTVQLANFRYQAGDTIAFTCVAGKNRSALLAALLLVELGVDNRKALSYVTEARKSPGGWGGGTGPALDNQAFRELILSWGRP